MCKKKECPVGRDQGARSEQRNYCNQDTEEKEIWMRATRNIGPFYRRKKKSIFKGTCIGGLLNINLNTY